jgi:hypothetical protein
MKTTIAPALCAVLASGTTHAASIAFDIGPLGGLDGDGGLSQTTLSGSTWNNFGQIAGAVNHGGVQDVDGGETSFTLRAEGVANRDGNPTLNAGWGGSVPQTAIDSWYFRGAGLMTLSFQGADPGSLWDVVVTNSFNTPAGNLADIQINGLFADGTTGPSLSGAGDDWDRRLDGWDNGTSLNFTSVAADSNGHLTITLNGGNPTLQALQFTPVPEPGTAFFGALGAVVLLRRKR